MSESDDDDENNWNELEEPEEPIQCLFCTEMLKSIEIGIEHLNIVHQFDLSAIKQKFNLEQYSYIKMINFIRMNKIEPSVIKNALEITWNDDVYLKPVQIDLWLMFGMYHLRKKIQNYFFFLFLIKKICIFITDIDELQISHSNDFVEKKSESVRIDELERTLDEKNKLIEFLINRIEQMKTGFRCLLDADGESSNSKKHKVQEFVGDVSVRDDEGYFITYSHFDIHHDMLSVSNTQKLYSINNNIDIFFSIIFRTQFVQVVTVMQFWVTKIYSLIN